MDVRCDARLYGSIRNCGVCKDASDSKRNLGRLLMPQAVVGLRVTCYRFGQVK